jgi:hypothetical protein
MEISADAREFVEQLQSFSGNKLHFPEDLMMLLDLARNQNPGIDEVSFSAKFIHQTQSVMQRIGPQGEGYVTLTRELEIEIQKVKSMLIQFLVKVVSPDKEKFTTKFLNREKEAFGNFLRLCSDLRWIKNWKIDFKGTT